MIYLQQYSLSNMILLYEVVKECLLHVMGAARITVAHILPLIVRSACHTTLLATLLAFYSREIVDYMQVTVQPPYSSFSFDSEVVILYRKERCSRVEDA